MPKKPTSPSESVLQQPVRCEAPVGARPTSRRRPTIDPPVTQTTVTTSEEVLAIASEAGAALSAQPTYDEIANAAYQRYLSRGGSDGRDFEDWIEAERELRERGR